MARTRGRPKGSGKYPRMYRLRLSEEQYTKLKRLALLLGIDTSRILRALIDNFISGFDIIQF